MGRCQKLGIILENKVKILYPPFEKSTTRIAIMYILLTWNAGANLLFFEEWESLLEWQFGLALQAIWY